MSKLGVGVVGVYPVSNSPLALFGTSCLVACRGVVKDQSTVGGRPEEEGVTQSDWGAVREDRDVCLLN